MLGTGKILFDKPDDVILALQFMHTHSQIPKSVSNVHHNVTYSRIGRSCQGTLPGS